jgi:WD40 repeat protein
MNDKAFLALLLAVGAIACKGTKQTEADRPQAVTADRPQAVTADRPAGVEPAGSGAAAPAPQTGKDQMHRHNVFVAALSGDGARIITGSVGGEVLVWSTRPFVPVRDLPPPANRGKISALALSPDGTEALVAPDWKPAVERWDVGAGAARGELAAHTGRTTALAYAPAGDLVATGGADRVQPAAGGGKAGTDDEVPQLSPPAVRLWKQGARLRELTGLKARVGALAFNHDGSLIAAGGDDAVKVWRTADGAEVAAYDLPGEAAGVAFRGEDVCAVSSKAAACFTKRGAVSIKDARAPTRAAAITGGWLASGTYEEVEVRDATGAVRATLPGRAYAIVGRGDDLWVILADQVIPVRSGVAASPVLLKVPQK